MAEYQRQQDEYNATTDDEASCDDEDTRPLDDFRYMPLDDTDAIKEDQTPDMDNVQELPANNGNTQPATTRSGYTSSGCESSDIEVIQESSDSIEVLHSCTNSMHIDNNPYPNLMLSENENQIQNQQRLKDFEDQQVAEFVAASRQNSATDVNCGTQQDSLSSDTATIKSSSSNSCSNIAMDEDQAQTIFPEQGSDQVAQQSNLEAEAREIFAAIDALDREHNRPESPLSSSGSTYDSPSHRPLVPLEPNIVNFEDGFQGRPDSLSLPRPLQYYEKRRLIKKDSSASSLSEFSSRSSSMDALIEAATSTPLQAQGIVTTEGDMVAFVASGLDHMIRMSSPLSRKDSSGASYSGNMTPRSVTSLSSSTSGWSTSSASGWSYSGLSRSPSVLTQSPDDIPPIDPRALMDLEVHARRVAASLDKMMATLKTNLFKMSSLTYSCLDAYKEGIDHTCDAVDSGIKSMYALMAKCEELSSKMRPIYQLQKEIQEINRLLDLFEAQMSREGKKT